MYTRETDIYTFINVCDMVVDLLNEKYVPTLVKYLVMHLKW